MGYFSCVGVPASYLLVGVLDWLSVGGNYVYDGYYTTDLLSKFINSYLIFNWSPLIFIYSSTLRGSNN